MYDITPLARFERLAKRLRKKYPSLPNDLAALAAQLSEAPITGTSLGHNCYKIRLGIASKGRGKSGGARVITCVVAVAEAVYLLAIYDKSARASLADAELRELLAEIPTT